jgi:hypothetical protein
MTRYAPQWLQASSYAAGVDRRLLGALWPIPAIAGCAVTPGTGMQVVVAPGQVAVPTPNNTGTTLCTSDAPENVALIAAPASGNNRIDLIVCQARGNDLDGGVNNDFIFTAIAGVVAATPTVPAIPAGAVAVAQVYVGGGVSSVAAGNITDRRPISGLAVPTNRPWNVPWGEVSYASTLTAVGSISTTYVTVMTYATFTAIANRIYVFEFYCGAVTTPASSYQKIQLVDGAGSVAGGGLLATLGPGGANRVGITPARLRVAGLPAGPIANYRVQANSVPGNATFSASAGDPGPMIARVVDEGPIPGSTPPPN